MLNLVGKSGVELKSEIILLLDEQVKSASIPPSSGLRRLTCDHMLADYMAKCIKKLLSQLKSLAASTTL